MTSKLQILADRLRAAVAAKPVGWVNHTLPGGLDLVLAHDGEKWRLALRREKVYPSESEADILTRVFGVAEGTEPNRRKYCEVHPDTQRRIQWQIIEYNWIEADETA